MIVSAGLSPAWQQILRFDQFHLGEVNRARQAVWCASGKAVNVSIALHHLFDKRPEAAKVISTLGGRAVDAFETEFAELGLSREWIRVAEPTRICTTILDDESATATELVENVGPISTRELAEFEATFADAVECADAVVLTGSLAAGAPDDFYLQLLKHVSCHSVVDARGAELLAALAARPLVVKPNRAELAQTLDCTITDDETMRNAIGELQRRGAQWVVVTDGRADIWIGAAGDFYRATPPQVDRVVNAIGCGDCFAAGIAWGLGQGREPLTAIRYGMAAAAENLRSLLPARLDAQRVSSLAAEIAIQHA